jgi:hypothetical protein
MDNQEATERMTVTILEKLSDPEKQRVFRIKADLEKILRRAGPLGTLAFAVLAVDLQGGKKPALEPAPTEDRGEKMARINLASGGFDDVEINAMISECRGAGLPFHTLHGHKKVNPAPPDGPV